MPNQDTETPATATFSERVLRTVPLAAPALLLIYAAARYVDGRDGDHGPKASWNVGHLAFLGAFLGFGLLTVGLRRHLRGPPPIPGWMPWPARAWSV